MKNLNTIPKPSRQFDKMQSIQNYFVIVDAQQSPFIPTLNPITKICSPYTVACAPVAAAQKLGFLDNDKITVNIPGGNLFIEFKQPLIATMTGPAEYCFSGYFLD